MSCNGTISAVQAAEQLGAASAATNLKKQGLRTHRCLEEIILDSCVVVQRLADAHQAQVDARGAASRQLLPVRAHCAAQCASDVQTARITSSLGAINPPAKPLTA